MLPVVSLASGLVGALADTLVVGNWPGGIQGAVGLVEALVASMRC